MLLLQPAFSQVENIRKFQQSLPALRDSLRYVDALNTISLLLYEQNLDSTHYYAVNARAIARRLQYPKGIADATNNLGIVFDLESNSPLALRYYNDAYNQYFAIGDSSNMVQTLMNIGLVYNTNGNNQKAVSNFKQALAIGAKIKQDSIFALVIYNFLLTYPGEFTPISAAQYITKATQIATKYRDTRLLVAIKQLQADNYIKTGQRDAGLTLLKQTVADAMQMKLYYLSMDPAIDLADQLMLTDTAEAIANYKKTLALADQNNFHSYSKAITKKLYHYYSSKNNIGLAYYYSQKLLNAYEAEENTNDTSRIDYIEYALKDQQLEAAQVKSAYSNRLLALVAAICILAIAIIIIQLGNRKRSQKTHAVLKQQFVQLESATEALEKSNKDYARLIRIVAHDLRNPIGAINSISKLVIDDNKIGSGEKEWLKLIQKSSQSCLQLISELLETDFILKEEALHKENIDISGLLQQTVKLLGFRAQEKNQQIVLHDSVNAFVYADYNKLARVLNNLIVNAIKFSSDGADIFVESNRTAEGILISVKDTGIGIPTAIADKLFDPFTNAKRTGTAGEQSFGLGLYISKQIIEAHHGRIWFESEAGKGTTFYVLLEERKE
jgi:signal transduction histidine kinase